MPIAVPTRALRSWCSELKKVVNRMPREERKVYVVANDATQKTIYIIAEHPSGITYQVCTGLECDLELSGHIVLSVLQAVSRAAKTKTLDLKVFKSGLEFLIGNSRAKLEFSGGAKPSIIKQTVDKGLPVDKELKGLIHSTKPGSIEQVLNLVSISGDGYAYGFRYTSLTRVKLNVPIVQQDTYLPCLGVDLMLNLEQALFCEKNKHVEITNDYGRALRILKIKSTDKDYVSIFKSTFDKLGDGLRITLEKAELLNSLQRTRAVIGESDVEILIRLGKITLRAKDSTSNRHTENIKCNSSRRCSATTKLGLLLDCCRAMQGDNLSIVIPELKSPSPFLHIESGNVSELIALRVNNQLSADTEHEV